MSDQSSNENPTFALSEEWRAEFCGAAVERIRAAATEPPAAGTMTEQRAARLPAGTEARGLERSFAGFKKLPPDRIGYPPEIGDKMPDGTIYAGISPDTHEPMYTTAQDEPELMTWKEAMKYAGKFKGCGHKDWRVPSKGELTALFNRHAAIGGFGRRGEGWHWPSEQRARRGGAEAREINHATEGEVEKRYHLVVRLVRG